MGTIAHHAPQPAKRAVRAVRNARRAMFETIGSDRYSAVSASGMDRALAVMLGRGGTFVEAGANDGVRQSNTYLLERFYGWTGVLVEPVPSLARDAARNRPNSIVVNAALAAPGSPPTLRMRDHDLQSKITDDGTLEVPARTLSSILDEHHVGRVDLLSLDVEGYEESALAGLDLDRHAPRFLLIETWGWGKRGARIERELLHGRYSTVRRFGQRDALYALH